MWYRKPEHEWTIILDIENPEYKQLLPFLVQKIKNYKDTGFGFAEGD